MNKAIVSLLALAAATAAAGASFGQDMPPAVPGQCFGRVRLPDAVDETRERVMVSPGRVERRGSPPVVRWTTSRVLVRAASRERIVMPAVYRNQSRWVQTPGREYWAATPAQYRRVSERVLVAPGHAAWVPKRGVPVFGEVMPGQTEVTPTGEILCRIWIPARYAVKTRLVMVAPGRKVRRQGPPTRHCVTERVLVTPARTIERAHPAVYRTVRTPVVIRPGRSTVVRTPAEYRWVSHERRVARAGWAQVVCPAGLAPWAMQRMQSSLVARGYDAGPADGRGTPQTYEALRRFQRDHGLAEGQITVESARALGVIR